MLPPHVSHRVELKGCGRSNNVKGLGQLLSRGEDDSSGGAFDG